MLLRQAARIAINRTIAGVHYPVDSVAGAMLGKVLAQYLSSRAGVSKAKASHGVFDGMQAADADFDYKAALDGDDPRIEYQAESKIEPCVNFKWLWKKAIKEWR